MPCEALPLPEGGEVPNNALPARLYRAALAGRTPSQIEAHLAERGWTNTWQGGVYPFHHYHSTAHEVLVIARGQASVTLGGEGGVRVRMRAGDVLLLPAWTGHKNDGGSADLLVIGAYAGGRAWDVCRPGEADAEEARARIARVPGWNRDPVDRDTRAEHARRSHMPDAVSGVLADLLSRDTHRAWKAACAVNGSRDPQLLATLAEHLPEIERATENLELGGALFPNRERLRQAIITLHACQDGHCRCWLYPQFLTYDPRQEEETGDVLVLSASPPDWNMTYRCRCLHCGAEYEVEQGEMHLTWWQWRKLAGQA